MNDGTFDGALFATSTGLPASVGHERTGFIARVKFRKEFAVFYFLSNGIPHCGTFASFLAPSRKEESEEFFSITLMIFVETDLVI